LDERDLEEAVEIGARAYRLLAWVSGAVEKGFIDLDHAGRYVGDPEAAEEWLAKHFLDLPADARPLAKSGGALRRFANYFATYLNSSFDLHEVPGTRWDPGPDGYCCPLCGAEVTRSHLRPKKLGRRDKYKARLLKRSFLQNLAREGGIDVKAEQIDRLLEDREVSRSAALATYGDVLLRRLTGHASGPATLALWREFAWTPKGSPIKGFKLDAASITDAEARLLAVLRNRLDSEPVDPRL
jgi:hypothetical protein